MARPSKYNWDAIEADFKAGVPKNEIRRRHSVPRNSLDNKIRDNNWEVNEDATAVMQGFEAVSGHLGAIQAKNPEILGAVYDRIMVETDFDIRAGRIVAKTMQRIEDAVDSGKVMQKLNVGVGIQNMEPVQMGPRDLRDVADAVYRCKEVLKGKEAPAQINVQNNLSQITHIKRTIVDSNDGNS